MEESFDFRSQLESEGSLAISSLTAEKLADRAIEKDGVRIIPGAMIFRDAYDGKVFTKKLTLTNCSKKAVFIRILSPSSKAFKMKTLSNNYNLPSGLSISRTVKYVYNRSSMVTQACLPIFINNVLTNYEFLVCACYADIKVNPNVIDFGEVDVGSLPEEGKITLTNIGSKTGNFSIDLGRNPLELVVKPLKGMIQPNQSQEILVEIFGRSKGSFLTEIWLKIGSPQRVKVVGKFIQPKLRVDYPIFFENVVTVTFPKTYVGVRQSKSVVIKNHSSTPAMYCVLVREHENSYVPFKVAQKTNLSFRPFEIFPYEGRLHPEQRTLFNISFQPPHIKNSPNYYICMTTVDFLKARAGNPLEQKDEFEHPNHTSITPLLEDSDHHLTIHSEDVKLGIAPLKNSVYLILYGEIETPKAHITASQLHMKDLYVNSSYMSTVNVENMSKNLPVVCKYNKVPYVDAEPKQFELKESSKIEVALKIRPGKIGYHTSNISFDVFYVNEESCTKLQTLTAPISFEAIMKIPKKKPTFVTGITPLITNEVGYLTDDIRFNTKMKLPRQAIVDQDNPNFRKSNDALMAFPNDRGASFRPWRTTVPCKTIFANIPRAVANFDDQYDLKRDRADLLNQNKSYYKEYLKKRSKIFTSKSETELQDDYEVTNNKLLLMNHLTDPNRTKTQCAPAILNVDEKNSLFPPLSPYELHQISLTPKFINLGKVAMHADCTDCFNLENKNDFAIHISCKARYQYVTFPKREMIVLAQSNEKIFFTYRSESSGNQHVPVFITVNLNNVFDLTVLASTVSKTLQCVTESIFIRPTSRVSFLELKNTLNSDVSFTIDTQYFHIEAFPSSGVIPANKHLVTTITLIPAIGNAPVKELTVFSESGAKQLIEIRFERKKAEVALSKTKIIFTNVPLNTQVVQEFTIRNKSDQLIQYCVDENIPSEIQITPAKRLIDQNGDLNVKVKVKFTEIVEFSLPIKLTFQHEYNMEIVVSGNVVFPAISFTPQLIKIPKQPSESVSRFKFKVFNKSDVEIDLSFPLREFPEFRIRNQHGKISKVQIPAQETATLFLEFAPTELQAYSIYLPFIINDILGPTKLNTRESLNCASYLSSDESSDKQYKKSVAIPSTLPVLKIICAASNSWVNFSNMDIHLTNSTKSKETICLTNVSDSEQEVIFDWRHVDQYFKLILDVDENDDVGTVRAVASNLRERILHLQLGINEAKYVTIVYEPQEYGEVSEEVPVFLMTYSEKNPFTYLNLSGTSEKPSITSENKVLYLLPIRNIYTFEQLVTIKFFPHGHCQEVEAQSNHEKIKAVFLKESATDHGKLLQYKIIFNPGGTNNRIEAKVVFSCRCMSYEVFVNACSDSCSLLTYAADLDYKNYPLFPELTDDSDHYSKFLCNMSHCIEKWLYSQGFYYQNFHSIPETINRYPAEIEQQDKKKMGGPKKKEYPQLPLVQFLINLMDSSILRYIDNGIPPSDEMNKKVLYNYVTYRNTLSFLKSQNIFVPGLRPEHLLGRDEYLYFLDNFQEKEREIIRENFTEHEFYLFSKQQWFTLFFHIYKNLVLERVVDPQPLKKKQICPEPLDVELQDKIDEFEDYYRQNCGRFDDNIEHKCESKLILWLEFHYNREKSKLWSPEECPDNKLFTKFDSFNDSVAFASVTVAFCPYLLDNLSDLYPKPENVEQLVHNACRIVQAWKTVYLSFELHPAAIVKMQKFKLIMLVTYLYEVLPHYFPTKSVVIEAPLSETSTYELSVKNCGKESIQYTAVMFGEDQDKFTLSSENIIVPGTKDKKLAITYNAKKMGECSIILVLSGEVPGQKYARSTAVNVKGVSTMGACKEIKMKTTVFKKTIKKVKISSPYSTSYSADIIFCNQDGIRLSLRKLHSLKTLKQADIPREINIAEMECEFKDKGEGMVTIIMLCLYPRIFWFDLCFSNEDVGDFSVRFKVNASQTNKECEDIILEPSIIAASSSCICKSRIFQHCPKTFNIEIPCRNQFLWDCVMTFRESYVSSEKKIVAWNKYFGTPLIFRVFRFYLNVISPQDNLIPSALFNDQAEYEIVPNKSYSTTSPTLKIPDVTSSECVVLTLHWNEDTFPETEYLYLKNKNELETRLYRLVFPKLEENSKGSLSFSDEQTVQR